MTMHRKGNVLILSIYVQKGQFWGKKNQIWPLFCLRILSSSSLFWKMNWLKYYNNIILLWVPVFFYHSTSLPLPPQNPLGPCRWIMQALKHVFFGGPQISWSLWHFFSLVWTKEVLGWVQQPIIDLYRILRQLHGPWCKQPLSTKGFLVHKYRGGSFYFLIFIHF